MSELALNKYTGGREDSVLGRQRFLGFTHAKYNNAVTSEDDQLAPQFKTGSLLNSKTDGVPN